MKNSLYVAWRGADPNEGWGPVGKVEFDGGFYRYFYTRGATMLPGFHPFPQMTDLEQVYESAELFPLFANRLLSRSRQEYEAFLRWTGFDSVAQPDPIAILGVTEGLRQTDRVEVFPCPMRDADGNYRNKFFLHGLRWQAPESIEKLGFLAKGGSLRISPEPGNTSDSHAVALHTGSHRIGYVPRYLAKDVSKLLKNAEGSVQVEVERVNLDAPMQQRLLCQMIARWPEGFEPCEGQEFAPIPQNLPAAAAT